MVVIHSGWFWCITDWLVLVQRCGLPSPNRQPQKLSVVGIGGAYAMVVILWYLGDISLVESGALYSLVTGCKDGAGLLLVQRTGASRQRLTCLKSAAAASSWQWPLLASKI